MMQMALGRISGFRLLGLLLVALLHALLVYALVQALSQRSVESRLTPIETRIIEAARPVAPPTSPAPPVQLTPPSPVVVAPPELRIEKPAPAPPKRPTLAIVPPEKPPAPPQIATQAPAPAPAPAAPAAVQSLRIAPKIDARRSQEPPYPPLSRRLGEQGSLVLEVLVATDGRVLESKLVQSSGFERLDQAALAGVKTSYRFLPGSIDGKPAEMWYSFKFTWKLH